MSPDAYRPYAPLDTPKPFAPDLWIADGPEIGFKAAGLEIPFPTRMTVARLEDGGLWVHSPIALTDGLAAQVAALGEVRFLVAPNNLHYWWLGDWAQRFPGAQVFAIPGLARTAKRSLPPHRELAAEPPPWAGEIDQLLVLGGALNEAVFLHRRSRTLILTDLIENFELSRVRGLALRLLLRLAGPVDPDGKAPIDMRLSFLGRRRILRAAVERMIAWDPQRIVVAHGRCYEADGAAELRRAFRWVL